MNCETYTDRTGTTIQAGTEPKFSELFISHLLARNCPR